MPEGLNWQHIFTEGAVYLIPTIGLGYIGYRKLIWTLGEFRPHRHTEKHGALDVDGIIYPLQNGTKP